MSAIAFQNTIRRLLAKNGNLNKLIHLKFRWQTS